MKKTFSTIFAVVCFAILVFGIGISYEAKNTPINSDILRFHIIANSDSARDQALKYMVRDEIYPLMKSIFSECDSVEEAAKTAEKNKAVIKKMSEKALENLQSNQDVRVFLGKKKYPEKVFCGRVFPEGEYLSLRLVLGEGKGQNWWCVLFPEVCQSGIEYEENESRGTMEMFGCKVKFKILDYLK